MNTADHRGWKVGVAGAATTLTVALLPNANATPAWTSENLTEEAQSYHISAAPMQSDRTVGDFYRVIGDIELSLGRYAVQRADDVDEIFEDLYMDLEVDLRPRNADRWRDVEVEIVRAETM